MRRFRTGLGLGLAVCLAPMPALADGKADGKAQDCGGDAYTFAEVVPAQPGARHKGPIMVLPDTLCADLAGSPGVRFESLNVFVDPRGSAEDRSQGGLPAPSAPSRRY